MLNDSNNGNTLFRADSDIANHRSIYWAPAGEGLPVSSIFAQTLTDITVALIYFNIPPIGDERSL